MKLCSHKTQVDHVVNFDDIPRIWRCSHCGKTDYWSDSWTYYGNIECKICWATRIDFVACSETCLKELKDTADNRQKA